MIPKPISGSEEEIMGVVFRVGRSRKDTVRINYFTFSQFRKSLAEAIGFTEWISWHDKALKNMLFEKEEVPEPPICSYGNFALGFNAFCNSSDAEGRIETEDLTSLAYLFRTVKCIKPFTGDERDLTKYQENYLNELRYNLLKLTERAIDKDRCIIWD